MANSIGLASGVSSFVQAFSAIDAVGSRRRREKLLDARLADEREFRAQQIEFQQAGEDRAQTAFDETREQIERRRQSDAIALDPDSTDAELREAAKDGALAQQTLLKRQQQSEVTGAITGLANARLVEFQAKAVQEGERGGATEQLRGLSQGVEATELPGDVSPSLTRKVSKKELARQRGEDPSAFLLGFELMPADFRTLDEIEALGRVDPDQAMAIRKRQTAELIEATGGFGDVGAAAGKSEKAAQQSLYAAFANAADPAGDAQREFAKNNPTAATIQYFDARNSLTIETRRVVDKQMKPVVEKSLVEQRIILDADDAKTDSQDYNRARQLYSKGLGLEHAIVLTFDPNKEGGIDGRGVPNNASGEALADGIREQFQTGPRTSGMMPDNKLRQATAQLVRDHANPTKRASAQQVKNLYILTQAGMIKPEDAIWAAWHGGQLRGPMPEHILVGKDQTLMIKTADGFRVIRSPVAPERELNKLSAQSRLALERHYSQYDTDDNKQGGARYLSTFLGTLGRTRDKATARGYDLSSPIDIVSLARTYDQAVIFEKIYNEQFWEFGPDFFGKREDYAEHFVSLDDSLYNGTIREFLDVKSGEILNEFRDVQFDAPEGSGVNVSRFVNALQAEDPAAAAEFERRFPSTSAKEQAILQAAQQEQQ